MFFQPFLNGKGTYNSAIIYYMVQTTNSSNFGVKSKINFW